jgi:uncharacterized membrane protein required for colicin V production
MTSSLAMHLLVLALAGTLILGLYHGYRGGLIKSASKLVGLIAGFLLARPLAWLVYPYLEQWLEFSWSWFLLIFLSFLAISIACGLAGFLLSKMVHWSPLKWLDKGGGAVLGVAMALLVNGLILSLLDHMDILDYYLRTADGWEAQFLHLMDEIAPPLFDRVRPLIDEVRDNIPKGVI